ncbi:MAG: hypothetical protein NTY64_02040 [Deltaproteobacteria bacterium]|nr:hypothetical protein [Deltaproteobacteria bacterium]
MDPPQIEGKVWDSFWDRLREKRCHLPPEDRDILADFMGLSEFPEALSG